MDVFVADQHCEVYCCNKDVFSSCHLCSILLCFEHFSDINFSCTNHISGKKHRYIKKMNTSTANNCSATSLDSANTCVSATTITESQNNSLIYNLRKRNKGCKKNAQVELNEPEASVSVNMNSSRRKQTEAKSVVYQSSSSSLPSKRPNSESMSVNQFEKLMTMVLSIAQDIVAIKCAQKNICADLRLMRAELSEHFKIINSLHDPDAFHVQSVQSAEDPTLPPSLGPLNSASDIEHNDFQISTRRSRRRFSRDVAEATVKNNSSGLTGSSVPSTSVMAMQSSGIPVELTSRINSKLVSESVQNAVEHDGAVKSKEKAKDDMWKVVRGCNTSTSILKARTRLAHLHVFDLHPQTTTDMVMEFLKPRFPEVVVTKLDSKHPDSYASFKFSVNENSQTCALDPEMWPVNVSVKKFFHPRTHQPTAR